MENVNVNELFSTKMCSPLIVFIVIVVIFAISLFNTRNTLRKFGSTKMDNLFNVYSWHEVKMVIVLGIILYGLCQFNQVNLAWIFMFLPVIYLMLKNLLIFVFVSIAHQNAPKANSEYLQTNYGVTPQMQQAMQNATKPVDKTINFQNTIPTSTSISQLQAPLNNQMAQTGGIEQMGQVTGINSMGGMDGMGGSF